MPFHFLKYLQPVHYFRRCDQFGNFKYPEFKALLAHNTPNCKLDDDYSGTLAKHYDASWCVLQSGYIGNLKTYSEFKPQSTIDNYRFIRKNFHSIWVLYVCIIRIVTCHNPLIELRSWYKTRHVNRIDHGGLPIEYPAFSNFESDLLKEAPFVSVIIPTLNRYPYLKDVLLDFEKQLYTNFELIIVDQSDNFQPEFYRAFKLKIHVIRQEEKALWLARNTAIQKSKAEIIALSEDDVRIPNNWLSMHLKCLDFFKADVSAGVFYPEGQPIPKERSYFMLASQFATGNAMLYKSVFRKVGLFDRQFEKQRMGDGEFGMRVYLEGLKSISNPLAYCLDVKAGTGGLREMGSWDAFRPSSLFSPRPIPSVLYYSRRYFGDKASVLMLIRTIPSSILPYQFKKNRPMLVVGSLLSLLLLPFILIQVMRSWYLSSKKIKQGPQIPSLSL